MAKYRPKLQFKKQRRQRGRKRVKTRQYYRRNRHKIKRKQKMRYKKLKRNPRFKQHRKRRYRERNRRKRIASLQGIANPPELIKDSFDFEVDSPCPNDDVPDVWVAFPTEDNSRVHIGYVCDYDPEEDAVVFYDTDQEQLFECSLEDFHDQVVFLEESDLENWFAFLDEIFEYEDPTQQDGRVVRLADEYLRRAGRTTPTQFSHSQLQLPVTENDFDRAIQTFARSVDGMYDPQDGEVFLIGEFQRNLIPVRYKVMYRKYPCGFLKGLPENLVCVSFDFVPVVKGDPRRHPFYCSVQGPGFEAKRLFQDYLRFLAKVTRGINRFRA